MDIKTKTEVIRRFLNGECTYKMITRGLDISLDEAFKVLWSNETTAELLRSYFDDHKQGKYVSFFTDALRDVGRPKLPENQKRKIRQIRISDEELEQMENPNSTKMRAMMLDMADINKFCKKLDEAGIMLIPDKWLESDFNRGDPFFWDYLFSTNKGRLLALAKSKEGVERVIKDRRYEGEV